MLGCLDFSLSKRRDKAEVFSLRFLLSVGAGIAMSPRKRIFKTVSQRTEVRCLRIVVPDFVSSSDKLIWTQTLSGLRYEACSLRRLAILLRPTLCTQSKFSEIPRVLLDWMGPIKCQIRLDRSSSCRCLSAAS